MEFRLINESTIKQTEILWDKCFEKADSSFFQWYFSHYALKQNKIIGGFSGDKLTAMVHLNPYELRLRGKSLKTRYLVGIATDPCYRGQHIMGELLTTTFNLLRAAGTKVVILEPINAGIYLPYGFAYTYLKQEYAMPLKALTIPYIDYELTMEEIATAAARPILQTIYTKVMQEYDSYVERTEQNWENLLTVAAQEALEAVIVKENDRPVGYLLYNKVGTNILVQELMAESTNVQRRILGYLRGLAGTYETLTWQAGPDDLTYLYFKEQSYCPKVAPFMMSRIINVEKILADLVIPTEFQGREFILYIKDEFMPLNNTYAKVQLTAKGVVIKPTVDVPDLVMDITTFTQLYFGTYSAMHLYKQGKILGDSQELLKMLDVLLPKQNNFINEYF